MYNWVDKYVGIPFVSGGRDTKGCDCYGLVRLILENEYNYKLPLLTGDYSNALVLEETKNLFAKYVPLLTAEKVDSPEEKSVCLIQTKGLSCHVGIWADDGFIIHSRNKVGSVCEKIDSLRLIGKIMGWYRVCSDYCSIKSI